MKTITTRSDFYSLLENSRATKSSVSIFFHSPWMDKNALNIKKQLDASDNDEIYQVDIFEFPDVSEEFNVRRLPSLVTYYGDSKQYRVYDIPHQIRRSFVPPKIRNL
jgi:hypothetical protein